MSTPITIIINPPAVVEIGLNVSRSVAWAAITGKPAVVTEVTVTTDEAFEAAKSGNKKIITYGDREYYWNGTETKYMATYSPEPITEEENGNA